MKHIFVVHSHITYLAALGVIEHDGLSLSDCVLVSPSYQRAEPVAVQIMPFLSGLRANRFSIGCYLQPSKHIDRAINRLTNGERYTLYFSVTLPLVRVLMSNALCGEFHLLEEGVSAYVAWFDLPTMTTYSRAGFRAGGLVSRLRDTLLPLLRGYTSRLQALPIFYNAYQHPDRKFYGFSDSSYVQLAVGQRVRLSFESIARRFDFSAVGVDLSGATIWLGDCVDSSQSDSARYFEALEQGFIKQVVLANSIDRVFVKFHYRESLASRNATLELFARHGVEIEVIHDTVIMEIALLSCADAKLYGTYSSLLLYAAFIGHKAYSVDRFYTAGVLDKRICSFWEYVEKL